MGTDAVAACGMNESDAEGTSVSSLAARSTAELEARRSENLRRREQLHERYVHKIGKTRETAARELERLAREYIAVSLEIARRNNG